MSQKHNDQNNSEQQPDIKDSVIDEALDNEPGDTLEGEVISEVVDTDSVENPLDESSDAKQKLADLEAQVSELKDQYLRANAELDNVRKRSQQEIENARKFAVKNFSLEILTVKDSLDLAARVELDSDNREVLEKMHEGINLTLKQLESVFNKFNIVEIRPEAGDKLDPNLHQAVSMVPSEDHPANSILNVIQSGYSLNDRPLRPATVIVVSKA